MKVSVFVEGAAKGKLEAQSRRAFGALFEKCGLAGRLPAVFPCGARSETFKAFCLALKHAVDKETVLLLVDSESQVETGSTPWQHLRLRPEDGWTRPPQAADDSAHLMVQCMEAWFVADPDCLARYFGRDFHRAALPGNPNVEHVSKADVLKSLQEATRMCRQPFSKGRQSFEILGLLNPDRVKTASPHFARLIEVLSVGCRAD